MGYDIVAYFDIDQEEIESFIHKNSIDRSDWNQSNSIADHYRAKHLNNNPVFNYILYEWEEGCRLHEVFDYYGGTNFIRDDERLTNKRYQTVLSSRIGRPFPDCLRCIHMYVSTSEDAIEVANELCMFFAEDDNLMHFASWLKLTANYGCTYEFSC